MGGGARPNGSGVAAGSVIKMMTTEQRRLTLACVVEAYSFVTELQKGQPTEDVSELCKFINANWNGR